MLTGKRRYVLKMYVDAGLFQAVHYAAGAEHKSASTYMSQLLAEGLERKGADSQTLESLVIRWKQQNDQGE